MGQKLRVEPGDEGKRSKGKVGDKPINLFYVCFLKIPNSVVEEKGYSVLFQNVKLVQQKELYRNLKTSH